MRCISKILLILLSFAIVSCAPHKKLAYDFVNKAKGASVAFYVPEELQKTNLRSDCNPEMLDLILLDECQLQDTIEARIKILNKIDDEIFIEVVIASFEESLKDYGLNLQYWEDENTMPDSLHWVVDLSHIEIQEHIKYQVSSCEVEGNYEFIPTTTINVASWFELYNDNTSDFLFTEQDYYEYIMDCYYTLDSLNNLVMNVKFNELSVEGFYDFAVILGKLYAGYSFDYFMNEYVRSEMKKKGLEYSDDIHMRYDPYEMYIYYTRTDRLVEIN